MKFAFTNSDNEKIRDKIDSDLKLIIQRLKTLPIDSIILTGGFSRGEGTVERKDGKIIPLNDYDLAVITKIPEFLIMQKLNEISKELAKKIGIDYVDIAPVFKYRVPFLGKKLYWYDTKTEGRTIWGKDYLNKIPIKSPEELPLSEGSRQLFNRMFGLLLKKDSDFTYRQHVKAILACEDALLLLKGRYRTKYSDKLDEFEKLDLLEFKELKKYVRLATKAKLENKKFGFIKRVAKKVIISVTEHFLSIELGVNFQKDEIYPYFKSNLTEYLYYNFKYLKHGFPPLMNTRPNAYIKNVIYLNLKYGDSKLEKCEKLLGKCGFKGDFEDNLRIAHEEVSLH